MDYLDHVREGRGVLDHLRLSPGMKLAMIWRKLTRFSDIFSASLLIISHCAFLEVIVIFLAVPEKHTQEQTSITGMKQVGNRETEALFF